MKIEIFLIILNKEDIFFHENNIYNFYKKYFFEEDLDIYLVVGINVIY